MARGSLRLCLHAGMRPLRIAVLATVLATVIAGPADARSCGVTKGYDKNGNAVRATVKIKRGSASCKTAKYVGRKIITGRAPYHQGTDSYQSYFIVGKWRGGISTGSWAATNQVTEA